MKKNISVIFILIFISGCEQIIENPKWPDYKEKLVVTAWLVQNNPDSLEVTCAVRRTLPLSEKFDTTKIKVSNAVVTLSSGDFNQILQPQKDTSIYYSKFSNPKKSDYKLTIKWNGLTAFSELSIRKRDNVIDSAYLKFVIDGLEVFFFQLTFNFYPIPNGFIHELSGYLYNDVTHFYNWVGIADYTSSSGNVPMRNCLSCYKDLGNGEVQGTILVSSAPDTSNFKMSIELLVHSPSYEDYKNAKYRYNNSNGLFEDSPNGLNPKFNVMGDGIGFFWYEYHERKEVRY